MSEDRALTSSKIVERVCRALAYQTGQSDDWEPWDRHARAAILAVLDAIREPSEAMIDAAWAEALAEDAAGVWRAMIGELKREIAG